MEEIQIRLPWENGVLAAKWWGPMTRRPIICMHGWQDNAGTFDRLIPLLLKGRSFLAIDLPGHGLSSRLPNGLSYHSTDVLYLLSFLCNKYKWDKVSLLGHSLGSIFGFMFASVFPNKVDLLIQIDALKPYVRNPTTVAEKFRERFENFMRADQLHQENREPPSYTFEDMAQRMEEGTRSSVTKECAQFLLNRSIRCSEKFPGKFCFTRDSRLKYYYSPGFPQEVTLQLAKKLQMPHVFIKAKHSPFWERREYHDEVINILKMNKNFERHIVDSTHHLHLTEPEKVAPIILAFMEKHCKGSN